MPRRMPPILEPVPATIVFTVDPSTSDQPWGVPEAESPDGDMALDRVEPIGWESIHGPGGTFFKFVGDSPFVAHKLILDEPAPLAHPRNRFTFIVGEKNYAAGDWALARLGVEWRKQLVIAPGQMFGLSTLVPKPDAFKVRFYLLGEWGRPIA